MTILTIICKEYSASLMYRKELEMVPSVAIYDVVEDDIVAHYYIIYLTYGKDTLL